MCISILTKSTIQNNKSVKRKVFSATLNICKIYIQKHKNKTNITQSPGTFMIMIYLRKIINQKVIKF